MASRRTEEDDHLLSDVDIDIPSRDAKTYSTTFLIQNLHCNSCVTNIENALGRLEPHPVSISHSIVSQFIRVGHGRELAVKDLVSALDEAGYEIYDIISDAPDGIGHRVKPEKRPDSKSRMSLPQSWTYWGASREAERRKRKRHAENCDHCRKEEALEASRGSPPTNGMVKSKVSYYDTPSTDQILAQEDGANSERLLSNNDGDVTTEVTLDIEGMTCGACVGNVARALEEVDGVSSANVNLLTHTATVKCKKGYVVADLLEAVEDSGYGANVRDTKPSVRKPENRQTEDHDIYKASISIEGMTCSSCVNNVKNAVQSLDFVIDADVALVSNSASVTFDGRDRLAQILEAIEEAGYGASLNELTASAKTAKATNVEVRKIQLSIKGMYCDHCPMKIARHIKTQFGNEVKIGDSFSLKNSILDLEYRPEQPRLTITAFVKFIESVDSAFSVSVYHPPSLEERSKQMYLKEQRRILYRLALCILAGIPTFVIGIVYMNLIPPDDPGRAYLMKETLGVPRAVWALFVMATPVYLFAADLFHRRMLREVWMLWKPGSRATFSRRFLQFGSMSMLVSLGTSVAYFSSIAELIVLATTADKLNAGSSQYFDSVVFLTMFLLLGRFIEALSKTKTNDAVSSLRDLRPTTCLREIGTNYGSVKSHKECPADFLELGDVVKIVHGGTPPADGIVVDGCTMFNESSLTGEAKPVAKNVGDNVFSGTVNQGQSVSVRVTGVAGNSMLDRIMDIVREGQTRRAPVERIADILTGSFVPMVTAIAIVTWIIWLSLGLGGALPESYRDTGAGGWVFWSLQFAIASFVIACPCGIGLAAPTALFVGGGLAAKHGILVKGGGEAFQEASNLDCVVFDKTGTLTVGGDPLVTDSDHAPSDSDSRSRRRLVLGAARKLEQESSHPVARALVTFVESHGDFTELSGDQIEEIPGKGMKGVFTVRGDESSRQTFLLGNETLMGDHGVAISSKQTSKLLAWKQQGNSVVLLATQSSTFAGDSDWALEAMFAVADPIRPEAAHVIRELHKRNIEVWMLTGDNITTAHAVGKKVNISPANVIAGVLPAEKASKIKELQQSLRDRRVDSRWHRLLVNVGLKRRDLQSSSRRALVAMVGDGINDAPALATADVGIAMGSGTDIALHSAKFILLQSSLLTLLTLIALSRTVLRRIKFNFAWALIYNVIGIPIAAGALYPIVSHGSHIRLDPAWAALAMAASSVSVVLSSLSLRSSIPLIGFRVRDFAGDQITSV